MPEMMTRTGRGLGCLCGNWPDLDGFFPSLTNGAPVEPVWRGPWKGRLYVCPRCGRIADQFTLEVTGYIDPRRVREIAIAKKLS